MTTEVKERTKQFALKVIRLVGTFPRNRCADIIGRQLIRSATSVGACRGQTRAEFIAKMNITLEESGESAYWLGLAAALGYGDKDVLQSVLNEAYELTAIFVTTRKTARKKSVRQSDPDMIFIVFCILSRFYVNFIFNRKNEDPRGFQYVCLKSAGRSMLCIRL